LIYNVYSQSGENNGAYDKMGKVQLDDKEIDQILKGEG